MKKMNPEIPQWIKKGKRVWVEVRDKTELDVLEYLEGAVIEVDFEARALKVKMIANDEEREIRGDRVFERNESPGIVRDLGDISILNDPELLKHLEIRYKHNLIYTYCGPTLIAVNPYKRVEVEESEEKRHQIMQSLLDKKLNSADPHVWTISAMAYEYLFQQNQNQAICISGESGSGKTESTKRCLEFLANMKSESRSLTYVPIEQKILSCNPLLEAFGNAKTLRNDNSSRFGKYTTLFLDKAKKNVRGAMIDNYLLEKSRITNLGKDERCYHIFYAMLRFMSTNELSKYKLLNVLGECRLEDFNYLNQSSVFETPKVNDKEFYEDVSMSFRDLDFSAQQQEGVWKILASVLLLGNLKVDSSNYEEGSKPCKIVKNESWSKVISLLDVDESIFESGLTYRELRIGQSVTKSPLSPGKVQNSIDTIARELYSRMFNWMIKKINQILVPKGYKAGQYMSIGVLDIFGFEIFEKNSIEQLFINFANEKLQGLYIDYIFKNECKIFEEEGLESYISLIQYTDNKPIILGLDNPKIPPGIFDLVDQTCALNKNDETLHSEILKAHKNSGAIAFPKFAKTLSFIIKHTARDVEYITDGFVEKNKDELSPYLQAAIETGNKDIVDIFNEVVSQGIIKEAEERKNPKEKYLGFKFRKNMDELMSKLSACYCHFIRCIKPNELKKSDNWNPYLALNQVKYMGLLDSLKIRKNSFPFRFFYKKFFEVYQDLDVGPHGTTPFSDLEKQNADFLLLSKEIIKSLPMKITEKDLIFGKTRIFLNEKLKIELDKYLNVKQEKKKLALKSIQGSFKAFICKNAIKKYFYSTSKAIVLSRDLLKSVTANAEGIKFRNFLRTVRKIQRRFKINKEKKIMRVKVDNMIVVSKYLSLYKLGRLFAYVLNYKRKISIVQAMVDRVIKDSKNRYCKMVVNKIIDGSWISIRKGITDKAILDVQRTFRNHLLRNKRGKEREILDKKMMDSKTYNAAVTIQRFVKGWLVRTRLKKLNRSVAKIQGFFRMKWMRIYFINLLKATKTIQKNFRKYYVRKLKINEQMNGFLKVYENYNESVAKLEHNILFSDVDSYTNFDNISDYTKLPFYYEKGEIDFGKSNYKNFIPSSPEIELQPKAKLLSVLLDIDIKVDTTNIYSNTWAREFNNFLTRIHSKGSRMIHLEIGESFTLGITDDKEVYSWGLNDFSQCCRDTMDDSFSLSQNPIKNLSINNLRLLSAGKDHAFAVDEHENLLGWGRNSEGQLGLGHCRLINSIQIQSLPLSNQENIKSISAKEGINLLLTTEGRVFRWPTSNKGIESSFFPSILELPTGVIISNIDVGCDFTILLSNSGIVYSMGTNSFGELGLGNNNPSGMSSVNSLKDSNEKVVEISCGFKHVVVRTGLGRIYVWGNNSDGQLGLGDVNSCNLPTKLSISQYKNFRFKPRSIQAGSNSTFILMDDRQLYVCGKNGMMGTLRQPVRFYFEEKIFGNDLYEEFMPLKIYCKWSKTMTATYMMFVDFRKCSDPKTTRDKIVEKINNSFSQFDNQCKLISAPAL